MDPGPCIISLVIWLEFIGVVLAAGILLAGTVVVVMAQMLLRPARMTDAKAVLWLRRLSPGDLGLRFEEVRFEVRDEASGKMLKMAGWWIPAAAASDKTIVLVHGYTDAKVGAIAWAPLFHSLGWNILTPDLRAHGESEGTYTTAGYFERHDLSQIINQVQAQRPECVRRLALFGVSLGAAVVMATTVLRDDVAAVILESPFARYELAVEAYGAGIGAPSGILGDMAMRLGEWISGADFEVVRPDVLLAQIKCPVMLIQSAEDHFISAEDAARLREIVASRKNDLDVVRNISDVRHVLGMASEWEEYRGRVARFLESTVARDVREKVGAEQSSRSGRRQ